MPSLIGDISKVDGTASMASSSSFQWSQESTSALAKTDFASKTAALGSGLTRYGVERQYKDYYF